MKAFDDFAAIEAVVVRPAPRKVPTKRYLWLRSQQHWHRRELERQVRFRNQLPHGSVHWALDERIEWHRGQVTWYGVASLGLMRVAA